MGCGGSRSEPDPKIAENRRRLSIGSVDGEVATQESISEDRALVVALSEADIEKLLEGAGQVGERKYSIGSTTDDAKTSWADKQLQKLGDSSDLESGKTGIGFTCRKGLKPESPNQDSFCVVKSGDYSFYGVFDGHGRKGHDVSNFVKENMTKLILKDNRFKSQDMGPMLTDTFKSLQSLISTADRMNKLTAALSGTTATIAIHDHVAKKFTIGHVADSSCVIGGRTADGRLEAKQLTTDHKPNLKDERARIEKAGGRVVFDGYANHRVYAKAARYPGLNMSRCLGDLLGHVECGLSCEPEVSTVDILSQHKWLLLCSDGIWEFITPDQAVSIIASYPAEKAMLAAEKLAAAGWDKWVQEEGGAVVDDITVVLVHLNLPKAEGG
mmetsp:Transcript_72028/g.156376  ORF Transcript_72028/g.156376 Transcript_72028/m.156376 type:complete len:384 (+) Transcript_72028:78-1229(+)